MYQKNLNSICMFLHLEEPILPTSVCRQQPRPPHFPIDIQHVSSYNTPPPALYTSVLHSKSPPNIFQRTTRFPLITPRTNSSPRIVPYYKIDFEQLRETPLRIHSAHTSLALSKIVYHSANNLPHSYFNHNF